MSQHDEALEGPRTIPFPEAAAEGLAARNIRIAVGRELHARLSSRSERLGWNPQLERWANIPMALDRNLPPRALVVERHDDTPAKTTIAIVSWIGDIDDAEASRRKTVPKAIR